VIVPIFVMASADPSCKEYFTQPILRFTKHYRCCRDALMQLLKLSRRAFFSGALTPKLWPMQSRTFGGSISLFC